MKDLLQASEASLIACARVLPLGGSARAKAISYTSAQHATHWQAADHAQIVHRAHLAQTRRARGRSSVRSRCWGIFSSPARRAGAQACDGAVAVSLSVLSVVTGLTRMQARLAWVVVAAGASTRPLEVRREAARRLPRRGLAFLESSFSFCVFPYFIEATWVAPFFFFFLPLSGCFYRYP